MKPICRITDCVKNGWVVLLFALLLAGCATPSTVQSRKVERAAAYDALMPEFRTAVDQGAIKVGMPMDAVYIAWGPPAQALQNGSQSGEQTVWIYQGAYMEETRYWGNRRLYTGYTPRSFVSAEVVFVTGVVSSWRTLPKP